MRHTECIQKLIISHTASRRAIATKNLETQDGNPADGRKKGGNPNLNPNPLINDESSQEDELKDGKSLPC
jgi:hypothetical protein